MSNGPHHKSKTFFGPEKVPRKRDRNVSEIVRRNDNDREAIKREIEASTVEELMERYEAERPTVAHWEWRFGAYARRPCKYCGKVVPASKMQRNAAGQLAMRCLQCPSTGRPDRIGSSTKHQDRVRGEFEISDGVAMRMIRVPISRQTGYFNPYARAE